MQVTPISFWTQENATGNSLPADFTFTDSPPSHTQNDVDTYHSWKAIGDYYQKFTKPYKTEDTIFNKLAQLPTFSNNLENSKYLDGLQEAEIQQLKRKARSKWYTEKISQKLVELDSPMLKTYERALTCCENIKRDGKKLTSRYCNARHCHTCNRIRTAKAINGYSSQFSKISDLFMTTLTIPNVKANQLKKVASEMLNQCTNIVRVLREKKKVDISGVRKIEVTYNSTNDTYHPHIHILHSGNVGNAIIASWLNRYQKAKRVAQDTRIADQNSVNELFKYTTKIIVKDKAEPNERAIAIYLRAIDTIMISLEKKRTFQTFGKIKKVSEEVEKLSSEEYSFTENYRTYYVWDNDNYYDWETGQKLTQFKPPEIKLNFYG